MEPELQALTKRFIKENAGIIAGSVIISSVANVFDTLIVPKILSKVIKSVGTDKLKGNLTKFMAAIGLQKAIKTGSIHISNQIEPSLHHYILKELTKMVIKCYQETGEPIQITLVMEKVSVISKNLNHAIYNVCFKFLPLFITLVIVTISIFYISVKLGICCLICIFLFGLVMYKINYPNDIEVYKENVLSRIEDAFKNMEFIASSESGVDRIQDEIFASSDSYHKEKLGYTTAHTKTQGAGYLAGTIFYLGTVYYMYTLYKKAEIKDEDFRAYLLVLGKFYGIVFNLSYLLPQTVKIYKTMGSTREFLKSLYKDYPDRDDIPITNGNIVFNNVDFRYPDTNNDILSNYSVNIPSGTKVCLFGPSGSGKSTFVGLTKGNLVPTNGEVTIGGVDNSTISRKVLHSSISMVNQNTSELLNRSIYENMIFGLNDTPELRAKLEHLIMHYQINNVFNKPDTSFLDDQPQNLSGGQKQMVHLIHAFLQPNTKVLILDEPTSALDSNLRDNVIRMIDELNEQRGVTVLHISHDPYVKQHCDITIDFPL